MENIDPSIQGLSANQINFNLEMFNHPEIALAKTQADKIAASYPPDVVFSVLCQYRRDQEAGQTITNRVLPTRFENPGDFPRPDPSPVRGSHFYHNFCHSISAFDRAPEAEPIEEQPPDTQPEPAQVETPTPKPPVNELAEAIYEQTAILHHPASTPNEKETARAEIRRLQRRRTVREERQEQQRLGGIAGERVAPRRRREDDSHREPVPERDSKARLRELLKTLPTEIANPFAQEVTVRAKDILANDRIASAEKERRLEDLELQAISAIEAQAEEHKHKAAALHKQIIKPILSPQPKGKRENESPRPLDSRPARQPANPGRRNRPQQSAQVAPAAAGN